MKLISCDHCAVILDSDKLSFPKYWETEDGSIDERYCDYNQNTKKYTVFTHCPVCEEKIYNDTNI